MEEVRNYFTMEQIGRTKNKGNRIIDIAPKIRPKIIRFLVFFFPNLESKEKNPIIIWPRAKNNEKPKKPKPRKVVIELVPRVFCKFDNVNNEFIAIKGTITSKIPNKIKYPFIRRVLTFFFNELSVTRIVSSSLLAGITIVSGYFINEKADEKER